MNVNRITVRYTKALLEAAIDLGVSQNLDADMKYISSALKLPDFKMFLENPSIRTSVKNRTLKELFADKVNPLTLNFLELLTKNKREVYLGWIARNYADIYRKHFNISLVELTSSIKIDEKIKNKIISVTTQSLKINVELTDTINPEIIGGFIINIDGKQYDASIKHKLEKIKRELLQNK